jgi:hypothetical protein
LTKNPNQIRDREIITAFVIGLAIAYLRYNAIDKGNDLIWPLCAARQLLAGHDPYGSTCLSHSPDGYVWAVYPITTVITTLPFSLMNDKLAATVLLSVAGGLLAYGLIRRGGLGMLIVFLSFPAIETMQYAQWTFLIPAIGFIPALYPLTTIKPHVALPVVITLLTRRRLIVLAIIGIISLVLLPSWLWQWLNLATTYAGYLPLLTISGMLLLPLMFVWRRHDARYVLLAALAPQRAMYDAMILTVALRSTFDAAVWTLLTWILLFLTIRLGVDLPNRHVIAAYVPVAVLTGIRLIRRSDLRSSEVNNDCDV